MLHILVRCESERKYHTQTANARYKLKLVNKLRDKHRNVFLSIAGG